MWTTFIKEGCVEAKSISNGEGNGENISFQALLSHCVFIACALLPLALLNLNRLWAHSCELREQEVSLQICLEHDHFYLEVFWSYCDSLGVS